MFTKHFKKTCLSILNMLIFYKSIKNYKIVKSKSKMKILKNMFIKHVNFTCNLKHVFNFEHVNFLSIN